MTVTGLLAQMTPNPEPGVPWLLRLLGARWRDGKHGYRMAWGELSFLRPGWGLGLHLFDDPPHYSIAIHLPWLVSLWVKLPFLRRFAHEPHEMMETWGVSFSDGVLWLRWGRHHQMVEMPWHDRVHIAHDVMRPDGSWVPAVGSWERDKEPDGRHTETHPYRYLLQSGELQQRTATIHVERREWRLRWLRWTRSAIAAACKSLDSAQAELRKRASGTEAPSEALIDAVIAQFRARHFQRSEPTRSEWREIIRVARGASGAEESTQR